MGPAFVLELSGSATTLTLKSPFFAPLSEMAVLFSRWWRFLKSDLADLTGFVFSTLELTKCTNFHQLIPTFTTATNLLRNMTNPIVTQWEGPNAEG